MALLKNHRVALRMRFGRWKLVKDDPYHWHFERRYRFIPARWWR